jgi:LacI family transcriptional regulator
MPSNRVTIDELARHLGLSKFSVSRALSGKSGVGDATRLRVVRAASQLGYRPARPGSVPQRQVLFIMQDQDAVSSELWINMLHGADREGARRGLAIVPRQATRGATLPSPEASVAGIIFAVNTPDPYMPWAARTGLPVACAGYGTALGSADRVVGADWEGGFAAARHLAGLGHRRIGFVRGMAGLYGRGERWRGLCDGAAAADESIEVRDITFPELTGFREVFERLVQGGFAPTALFCAHDGLAITAISELLRFGIRVPDDISVVGFNDFVCATQIVPQLTTIRVPQEALGAALVRCIAMRIAPNEGIAMPPLRIALTPELIERDSTTSAATPCWLPRIAAKQARVEAEA